MIDLRPVEPGDLDVYVRMRTDERMMADLGGPQSAAGLPDKVSRDVAAAAADESWILMILPDPADRSVVAGTVALWSEADGDGGTLSEIGWMVLPEFQGRHIATDAVREVLRRAAGDGRWGPIHAYPAVTNTPSNLVCRRTGFTLLGRYDKAYRGRVLSTNHWVYEPGT